ncbi:MAG: pantetheine-phosphate adenylyltransferase [Bacteroidales bacterium]|jgi:pantetheine-phosphate adenylyltransferase|nr:pantetheine-phosphate adenylyltransferase [Bacteroidales bacterium]MDY0140800.1 pantetheine-phosphate adenylyltransferase [Bacteroidales bacterium]
MTKRKAIFPGSFDPFTAGHESVVERALPLFDNIIIAVGDNISKTTMLSLSKRIELIKIVFKGDPKVEVVSYTGLTVDFAKMHNCKFILRGLRTSADFEFERAIGQTNKLLNEEIETVFILARPEHTFISSSIIRDVYKNNGDLTHLLPNRITKADLEI